MVWCIEICNFFLILMNWPFIIISSMLYLFCLYLISINASVLNIIWLMSSYCIFILLLKIFIGVFLNVLNGLYTLKHILISQRHRQDPKFLTWISSKYLPCLPLRCCFPLISSLLCLVTHGGLDIAHTTRQECLPTVISLGVPALYCPGFQFCVMLPACVRSHHWVPIDHKDSAFSISHCTSLRLCFSRKTFCLFPNYNKIQLNKGIYFLTILCVLSPKSNCCRSWFS